jgi:hypothetical protein
MSWFTKKKGIDHDDWIEVGDCITYREAYSNLEIYFIDGPLKVIRVDDGPEYAGGKFVFVNYRGNEQGFYLNAIKKVSCY